LQLNQICFILSHHFVKKIVLRTTTRLWIVENKGSKLKALREEMRLMELRVMNIQQQKSVRKEENGVRPSEYAKVRAKAAYFQSQVSALSEQLREAKLSSMETQLVDHANSEAVSFHLNSSHLL
jgi:hypothetical protein